MRVLFWDDGVGKTTFLHHFLTGKFNPKYDASLLVLPEAPITFSTNHGPIRFQVRDVSGIVTERQTYGEFYMESHCAFIFFDVTSGMTCEHALGWHRALMGVRQAANLDPIPTVLLGNKVDSKNQRMTRRLNRMIELAKIPYFSVSVKSGLNLDRVFHWMTRQLMGQLRPPPLTVLAESVLRDTYIQQHSRVLKAANARRDRDVVTALQRRNNAVDTPVERHEEADADHPNNVGKQRDEAFADAMNQYDDALVAANRRRDVVVACADE